MARQIELFPSWTRLSLFLSTPIPRPCVGMCFHPAILLLPLAFPCFLTNPRATANLGKPWKSGELYCDLISFRFVSNFLFFSTSSSTSWRGRKLVHFVSRFVGVERGLFPSAPPPGPIHLVRLSLRSPLGTTGLAEQTRSFEPGRG